MDVSNGYYLRMTTNYADRVKLGAAILDNDMPGWIYTVDLSKLSLVSVCDCVLGQTFGDYGIGSKALGFAESKNHWENSEAEDQILADHGFLIMDDEVNAVLKELEEAGEFADEDIVSKHLFSELTEAWKAYITERLAATAIPFHLELVS